MVKTKLQERDTPVYLTFKKKLPLNLFSSLKTTKDLYVAKHGPPIGHKTLVDSEYAIINTTDGVEKHMSFYMRAIKPKKGEKEDVLPLCKLGNKIFITEFDLQNVSTFSRRSDDVSESLRLMKPLIKSISRLEYLHVWAIVNDGRDTGLPSMVDDVPVYVFSMPLDAAIAGPSKEFPAGYDPNFIPTSLGLIGNVNSDGKVYDAKIKTMEPIDTGYYNDINRDGEKNTALNEWQYMEKLADANTRDAKLDVRMRDACVELFYNDKQWEWSVSPAAQTANLLLWNTMISNPFRCSLIDGAEHAPNTKSSINIGDLDPALNEIACKPVTFYPSGAPRIVYLTGLAYCPMAIYGQIVVTNPAASWLSGHEGITRVVHLYDIGEMYDAFKISQVKSPQFWVWKGGIVEISKDNKGQKAAPRLLPNFLVNPGDATDSSGDTINSGGGGNTNNSNSTTPSNNNKVKAKTNKGHPPNYSLRHAARVWSKWVNRWVLPQLQKRYPKAEMTEKDLKSYKPMGTRFAADVDLYLVSHSLEAWQGAISGNNNSLVISQEQKKMYDKADLKSLERQFADIQKYWPELSVQYEWFMAEWPHEFGVTPGPPKGLQDQIILSNKYWDILAQGYNPMALFAIAAAEAAICGYIYYTGKPLWYAPASLMVMFGSYAAYITYYFGKDEFVDGIEKDVKKLKNAYETGKKDGSLIVKYSPYIITGVVGLTLTGLVVYETASTLGVAGSEVVGFELLAGVCITSAVEAGIWLNSEKKTIENKFKL